MVLQFVSFVSCAIGRVCVCSRRNIAIERSGPRILKGEGPRFKSWPSQIISISLVNLYVTQRYIIWTSRDGGMVVERHSFWNSIIAFVDVMVRWLWLCNWNHEEISIEEFSGFVTVGASCYELLRRNVELLTARSHGADCSSYSRALSFRNVLSPRIDIWIQNFALETWNKETAMKA